jgi:hypothetical protein
MHYPFLLEVQPQPALEQNLLQGLAQYAVEEHYSFSFSYGGKLIEYDIYTTWPVELLDLQYSSF